MISHGELLENEIISASQVLGSLDFWLNSAFLIAMTRVLWTVVQRATEWAIFAASIRTKLATFTIPAQASRPEEIKACKIIFVRYGNDQYLKELASDQEKNHGRLRNKVYPVDVIEQADGSVLIQFKIRIHVRLGTQFKLFVDVEGDIAPVVAYLESHDNVSEVSPSLRPDKTRVFFLVNDFPVTTTVEGFENNIIWPV